MEVIEKYMKKCGVNGDKIRDRKEWKGKIRVGDPISVDKG